MVPSTKLVMSSSAARWKSRKQIGEPYVNIEALAALSALLDLALKDQTPSTVLLSGASRASHDQNRGETHVTRDEKHRERIPTQSTIAPAASFSKGRDFEKSRLLDPVGCQ